MKTKSFFSVMALVAGVCVMTSCGGSSKQLVAQQPLPSNGTSYGDPFGPTKQTPLEQPDDENYWYTVGIASGPRMQMGQVKRNAQRMGQQEIRERISHAYKGMVSDYSNTIGNNQGNDIQAKLESAGDQIIDVIVNNTDAIKSEANVDEKGNVWYYALIRISKKEMAQKIAKAVSEDEELKIRFKEEEYRKTMEQRFANFKK